MDSRPVTRRHVVSSHELPTRLRAAATYFSDRRVPHEALVLNAGDVEDDALPTLFVHEGRPVIVRGYLRGGDLDGLSFDAVKARAGHHLLDPADKPGLVKDAYPGWLDKTVPLRLDQYLAPMLGEGLRDPELYPRYRNLRVSKDFRRALGLLRPPFLKPEDVNSPCIWIGPKEASTGLHTDPSDNFVLCVLGAKRFYTYSPRDLHNLHLASVGGSSFMRSPHDARRPDFETCPQAERAQPVVFDLLATDLLFLPFGWAHSVECLEDAFTYNYWLKPARMPFFARRTLAQ